MKEFATSLSTSVRLLLLFTLLLGGVYPLLVTAVSQTVFHDAANGNLIEKDGHVAGSTLLGQDFTDPGYFWGRLSATTPPYNAAASAGSNLSPANPQLLESANIRIAELQKADPGNRLRIPVDLVTASASGLDPHISIAAALYQAPRVARVRHMTLDNLKELMKEHTENRYLRPLGMPYVNIVTLNQALDAIK